MLKKNNLFFKVLELLKEKNMTQTELAKKAGLTQPSLSRILAGKYEIKITNLEKIANVLDVPVSYLVDNNEIKSDTSTDKKSTNDFLKEILKENNNLILKRIEEIETTIKSIKKDIDFLKSKRK